MAETKAEKARRYLAEGRLTVTRVAGREVRARVRGDTGVYDCGHDPVRAPHWRCNCEAWKTNRSHPDCSHLLALKLVVVVDELAQRQERLV